MNKLLGGSLCLTEINDAARAGHSAFTRGKNGKAYFNINLWLNETPDKYDNDMSVSLNSTKEKRDIEGKIYIGNAKYVKVAEPAQLETGSTDILVDDDLPF